MEQTGTKAKGTDGLDFESQRNSWGDGWGDSVLKRREMSDRVILE